jgi:murein tripeptide amidase MpaA
MSTPAALRIDDDFHGGRIEVRDPSDPQAVRLGLLPDGENPAFCQWFAFRVRGAKGVPCRFVIENANEATFADAFDGYRACRSPRLDDEDGWVRVSTSYDADAGELVLTDTPATDEVFYAYFAAYPDTRHERIVEHAAASPFARVEVVGDSVEGRDVTLIVVGGDEPDDDDGGDEDARAKVWITARQHPGETMAEWFVEGLLERLLDAEDETATELRRRATFYVVPNVCPDGAARGYLRSNAVGENLNRTWQEPTEEESPEVFAVRAWLEATGVDVFLDIHGDERTPYCFAAGCEGNPSYTPRIDALEDLFMESLIAFDGDFQRAEGYENDAPGEGDLTTASNWVGERFDCLSLTIEMPFKDNANAPDEVRGWSPTRAKALGAASLASILVCLDDALDRSEGDVDADPDDDA